MSARRAAKRPRAMRRWGFRVASRRQVGSGHMARCLSLARAMHEPVTFFLDPGPAWHGELTRLGVPWRQERRSDSADGLAQAMRAGEVDATLVDGYDFSPAAISFLASLGIVAVIDDFGDARGAQILINPSLAATAVDPSPAEPAILCGSSFALLNALYAEEHDRLTRLSADISVPDQKHPCRILVSMGAYDGANCTQRVLQALQRLSDYDIEVCVILSSQAPHLGSVQQFASTQDIRVVVGPDNLLALYRWADLAIGAAGVSQLERMCCGLPSALILLAENQRANCQAAEQLGCAKFLGTPDDLDDDHLAARLAPLLVDAQRRHRMAVAGLAAIDGQGSARVAGYLQDLPLGEHD